MRRIAIGLLLNAVVCLGAAAQTAAFKCPKPGLTVQYEDGTVAEATSRGENFCRNKVKSANEEAWFTNWYAPMASIRESQSNGRSWVDQVKPWTLWPLSVGKKISARYDGANNTGTSDGSWTFTFTVEKYERITTKAGTFDAFVIVRAQDGIGRPFKEIWRQWYAPEPGVNVKSDYWNNQGRTNKGDAVSIKGQ